MIALALALALTAAPRPAPGGSAAAPAPAPEPAPVVVVTREHDLSTATGLVELTWPALWYDRSHGETYVVAEGFVRIFDANGMETYRFGDDGSLGDLLRVVVLDDGKIIALTRLNGVRALIRCDYRGELISRLTLSGLPQAFADFAPDQLVYRNERLYFAESGKMRVVVTDVDGTYRQSFRLGDLVTAAVRSDAERQGAPSMDGFGVDASGNLLFTMSLMFAAGVVSPSGALRLFGTRGSTPGRFNIVSGIDADEEGNIYISDRLRSVVSVWSPELKHLGEFGYRGDGPTNLLAPFDIAVGGGHVFVAQAGNRGVRVFRVSLVRSVEVEPGAASQPVEAPARAPAAAARRP
jgi:hypothetical protein